MGVQVQTATKGAGGASLPILNRQFISFSYGYKKDKNGNDVPVNIEDFDLLASFDGDRLSKNIYSSFQDTTTEQTELDGQQFWSTSYKANELNFSLVTDGIDSKTLERFKAWFVPGIEKELILTEHHNRAIMARVSSTPQMSLLPFEKDIEVKIGENYYSTKTSLYKGDIKLSFVMDDPFWYSLDSCYKSEAPTENELKACYEDKIPFSSMIDSMDNEDSKNFIFFSNGGLWNGENISTSALNELGENGCYIYYPGTAKEQPKISFSLPMEMKEYKIYFKTIANNFNEDYKISLLGIPTISEESARETLQELIFSPPSIINSYNSVVDFIKENIPDEGEKTINALDIRSKIRDIIYDKYLLSWTMAIIDCLRNSAYYVDKNTDLIEKNGDFKTVFLETFKRFIFTSTSDFELNENETAFKRIPEIKISINSKTGRVLIEELEILRVKEGSQLQIDEFGNSNIDTHTKDDEGIITYTHIIREQITENAGNMIKTKYLIFEPTDFELNGSLTLSECLSLTSSVVLKNLKIDYKYKYL